MTWNFDLNTIPRGRHETRTRKIGDKTQEYDVFIPERVLLAHNDCRVYATYWIEPTKFTPRGRWAGWVEGVEPVAWMPYPEHPFAAASQGEAAAPAPTNVSLPADERSGDGTNAGGGHVNDGETANPETAGERVSSSPAPLITHKHIFLDDCGSGA